MNTILQQTYVDKSTWPDGPWKEEPDKIHFIDEETDMDCLIVRGPSGALCGYVAVEIGHPAFMQDYNRVEVDVHGGLTYGAKCAEGGKICHVPRDGKPHEVYWLGFDCAHSGDLCPSYEEPSDYGSYKDVSYVTNECKNLAAQLAKREPIRAAYDWE